MRNSASPSAPPTEQGSGGGYARSRRRGRCALRAIEPTRTRIASGGTTAQADIEMGFTIGIEHPVSGVVRLKKQQDLPVVGSAAVTEAAEAAPAAVEAALSAAVATAALRAVQAEMATTRRTLRAVEQRWIPRLSTALAEVRLELEELEHAEGVRHRWAAQQGGR